MALGIQLLFFSLLDLGSSLCFSSIFLLRILRSSSFTVPFRVLFNSYASANLFLHSLLAVSWKTTGTQPNRVRQGNCEIQERLCTRTTSDLWLLSQFATLMNGKYNGIKSNQTKEGKRRKKDKRGKSISPGM